MSNLVIAGDTSGSVTLQAQSVAGSPTLTLPTTSGTVALTSDVIGVGQTWQDATLLPGGRAIGGTYTNNTGKPIMVSVSCSSTVASGGAFNFLINGVVMAHSGAVQNASISVQSNITIIVPNGNTYGITRYISGTANIAISYWWELRA